MAPPWWRSTTPSPRSYPHLFGRAQPLYNRLYSWSGRHSELVLTSTAAARDDIARHWAVDAGTIRVIPLAADDAFGPLEPDDAATKAAAVLGFAEPYFLFVGKPTGRRRVTLLVEAFAAFKATTDAPHRLVFAGPPPDDPDELTAAAKGAAPSLHHTGFVPDDVLNVLYNAATGMVWPSIYEVVSLPIYEAHAAGTPLACVDTRGSRRDDGRRRAVHARAHARRGRRRLHAAGRRSRSCAPSSPRGRPRQRDSAPRGRARRPRRWRRSPTSPPAAAAP